MKVSYEFSTILMQTLSFALIYLQIIAFSLCDHNLSLLLISTSKQKKKKLLGNYSQFVATESELNYNCILKMVIFHCLVKVPWSISTFIYSHEMTCILFWFLFFKMVSFWQKRLNYDFYYENKHTVTTQN